VDFGDILDQWDRQTGRRAGGKNACAEESTPLSVWLRVNKVIDKDAESAAPSEKGERRRRLRMKKPEATLDLHGQTKDQAWISMDGFFRLCRQQGLEKLLIIHGKGIHSKGEAALKRVVRDYIERCPYAGESGQAATADGGSGATWVLLKDS
jgi:DNA-nicking Smr family endonuclease